MSPCAAPLPVSGAWEASGIGVKTASGAPDPAPESLGCAPLAVPVDAVAEPVVAGVTALPHAMPTTATPTNAHQAASREFRWAIASPLPRRDMRRCRDSRWTT